MLSIFKKNQKSDEKSGKRHLWIILAGGVVGIALLLFGGGSRTEEAESVPDALTTERITLYQNQLEARVKTLCEQVAGVGEVTVAVSLEGDFETIYATEGENREYVILGSGSSASPILLSHATPTISGIGIVCRGGSSPDVQRELISLLAAAFDVPTNRIYVTESK